MFHNHENHENFIEIEIIIFFQFALYRTDTTVPPHTCPNEVASNILNKSDYITVHYQQTGTVQYVC